MEKQFSLAVFQVKEVGKSDKEQAAEWSCTEMITDSIKNIERYRSLHKNLDTAITFLKTCNLLSLADGKHEIDGERVFINVMEADLRETEGALFEVHKRYADLQIDLMGTENWEYAKCGTLKEEFDVEKDFATACANTSCSGTLENGTFVLFFPGEYHKPSCVSKHSTHVRKAVIKIEMPD